MPIPKEQVAQLALEEARTLAKQALEADLGERGDITSNSLVPSEGESSAKIIAKEDTVICGQTVAEAVCSIVDGRLEYLGRVSDGSHVKSGAEVASLKGPARSLLAAERTVLNFLQRLSGVASLTSQYAKELAGSGVNLVDTRKTAPGWRYLQKFATLVGGAENHRLGLYDAVLIKENHLAASGLTPKEAVLKTRESLSASFPDENIFLQIEVQNVEELLNAIKGGPDGVLLDNFSPSEVESSLKEHIPETLLVEVSGGITIENIKSYALPGVDRISVGAITHSALSSDLSLLAEFGESANL